MKYVYIPTLSARKNPHINVKTDFIQELQKYLDIDIKERFPIYYISYTSKPKIGINPHNIWGTPIGVYTYPLRSIYPDIVNHTVPFAQDRPFIQVVKLKTKNILTDKYNKSQYEIDSSKLEAVYTNSRITREAYLNTDTYINKYLENASNIYITISNGFRGLKDCALTLATKLTKVNRKRKIRDCQLIWHLTQLIALLLANGNKEKSTIKWNWLLRSVLGYDVVVDLGLGFIHPHEKYQAVFLDSTAFIHVDSLDNKESSNYNNYDDSRPNYLKKFENLTEEDYQLYCRKNPLIKQLKGTGLHLDELNGHIAIWCPAGEGWLRGRNEIKNFVIACDCVECKFVDCTFTAHHVYKFRIEKSILTNCTIYTGASIRGCMVTDTVIKSVNSSVDSDYNNCEIFGGAFKFASKSKRQDRMKNSIIHGGLFNNVIFSNCIFTDKENCDFENCIFED